VNDSRKPGTGFWATVVLVAVVAAPLLYIASAGAAAFLTGKDVIEQETYEHLYGPLFCVEDNLPDWAGEPIDDFITWAYVLGVGFKGSAAGSLLGVPYPTYSAPPGSHEPADVSSDRPQTAEPE
jgi:hypothetical protein